MKYIKSTWKYALLFALLMTLLAACSLEKQPAEPTPTEIDPVAVFTSAAETVVAQMTQTALSFSPTPMPPTATPTILPTATLVNLNAPTPAGVPTLTLQPGAPTPVPTLTPVGLATQSGPICDEMTYGSPVDVNYPDYSEVPAGTNFEKIWRIYNTGVCTWDDGYVLVPVGASSPRPGDNNPLDAANPAWKLKTTVAPGEAVDVGAKLTAPLHNGEYQTHFMMMNDRGVYFGNPLTVIIKVVDGK